MRRTIHPSGIDGALVAPPSKSVMLRVAAAALLAGEETTRIENPTLCDDARSGLRVVGALGGGVEISPEKVLVRGGLKPGGDTLDCGESGLCLRMFTAVAALTDQEFTLTGNGSLLRRPVTSVEAPLSALGVTCRTEDGLPPVVVRGPLTSGAASVDGAVSSQFLSGLLLALPLVEGDSTVTVSSLASRPYVQMTLDLMARFGVEVARDGYERFTIPGGQRYRIGSHRIEGDWSAAAFLFVLGAVGGGIRVTGLDPDSVQADRQILSVIEAAGAGVTLLPDGAEVSRGDLRAFSFDATDAPDLLLPLSALACHCEGVSSITGVERLKHKESSRAEAAARELMKLGVQVRLRQDHIEIEGGPVGGGEVFSHGDHRVAMALAAAGVRASGPVVIDGAESVAKSYPGFYEDLAAVGGSDLMIATEVIALLPSANGPVDEQADAVLRDLFARLAASGREARHILSLTFFTDATDAETYDRRKARALDLVRRAFGAEPPPVSVVAQAPEGGRSTALEATVLAAPAPGVAVVRREAGGCPYTVATDGAVRQIHAAGVCSSPETRGAVAQSREAFDRMEALLTAEGLTFGHVVRQWNYIGGMLDVRDQDGRDLQGYQAFCDVRTLAYAKSEFPAGYPAATGIGQVTGGIVLEFTAISAPPEVQVTALSNPRQVDAHCYSTGVLVGEALESLACKTAPKFERAKSVARDGREAIYVSGAASILGEESVAIGDVAAQTRTAIENIVELTPEGRLSHLRAYVKRAADVPVVREVCTEVYGEIPALFVVADVCRDELLVELEGALVGPPGSDAGAGVG